MQRRGVDARRGLTLTFAILATVAVCLCGTIIIDPVDAEGTTRTVIEIDSDADLDAAIRD